MDVGMTSQGQDVRTLYSTMVLGMGMGMSKESIVSQAYPFPFPVSFSLEWLRPPGGDLVPWDPPLLCLFYECFSRDLATLVGHFFRFRRRRCERWDLGTELRRD